MEEFTLIFEDAEGNELFTKKIWAIDRREAKQRANIELAASNQNDLFKVTVKN